MKHILIVVDMQKDFVDGALGTKEAQTITPRVARKVPFLSPTTPITMPIGTPMRAAICLSPTASREPRAGSWIRRSQPPWRARHISP